MGAYGLIGSPLLVAVILSATSIGIVLPVLKYSGQVDTPFGQVIVAGASIAEFVPIVLLSLEVRVRGAVALLMLFAALATAFGLEAILGAFLAGATLKCSTGTRP